MTKTQKERLDEYCAQAKAGDGKARVALITEFMPIVESAAEAFVYRKPGFCRLRDDMVSEGYAKVVEIANDLSASSDVQDIRSFVVKAINRAFARLCDKDHQVGPSHTLRKAARDGGDQFPGAEQIEHCDVSDISRKSHDAGRREAEAFEGILECCQSDFDRDVIRLRVDGLVDEEIALQLKVSRKTVERARKRIESRYNEQCLALGA